MGDPTLGERELVGLECPRRAVLRRLMALLAALGVLAGLGGSAVAKPPSQLQISTQPSLFPTFDQSVTDYVVRCQPSNEVQVSVSAPGNTKVSVDDGQQRGGTFTQTVSLSAG